MLKWIKILCTLWYPEWITWRIVNHCIYLGQHNLIIWMTRPRAKFHHPPKNDKLLFFIHNYTFPPLVSYFICSCHLNEKCSANKKSSPNLFMVPTHFEVQNSRTFRNIYMYICGFNINYVRCKNLFSLNFALFISPFEHIFLAEFQDFWPIMRTGSALESKVSKPKWLMYNLSS